MHTIYKQLDKQYPNSKFIMHTRKKSDWLKSRSAHFDISTGKFYIDVIMEQHNLDSREVVLEMWSKEWDAHHKDVGEYFKDRPQDLLWYHINYEGAQKIVDFFKGIYKLEARHMEVLNTTKKNKQFKLSV